MYFRDRTLFITVGLHSGVLFGILFVLVFGLLSVLLIIFGTYDFHCLYFIDGLVLKYLAAVVETSFVLPLASWC